MGTYVGSLVLCLFSILRKKRGWAVQVQDDQGVEAGRSLTAAYSGQGTARSERVACGAHAQTTHSMPLTNFYFLIFGMATSRMDRDCWDDLLYDRIQVSVWIIDITNVSRYPCGPSTSRTYPGVHVDHQRHERIQVSVWTIDVANVSRCPGGQ